MSNILQYSVLRYSPSIVSGESINLGVLVTSSDYTEFFYTKRFSRVHEFDDTLDIETVRILLSSIADEVKGDLTTTNTPFDITSFIRYYCKEYCFSPVISVPYDDLTKKVSDIRRIYLQFDYEKSQRPTNKEALDFLKTILVSQGQRVSSNKNATGGFHEPVRFDMTFGNYGIKFFRFGSTTELKRIMNDIKAWAWNCEHYALIKPIIVYSTDIGSDNVEGNALLQTALEILKSATNNVWAIDETAEHFPNLQQSTK